MDDLAADYSIQKWWRSVQVDRVKSSERRPSFRLCLISALVFGLTAVLRFEMGPEGVMEWLTGWLFLLGALIWLARAVGVWRDRKKPRPDESGRGLGVG